MSNDKQRILEFLKTRLQSEAHESVKWAYKNTIRFIESLPSSEGQEDGKAEEEYCIIRGHGASEFYRIKKGAKEALQSDRCDSNGNLLSTLPTFHQDQQGDKQQGE